MSTLRPDGRPRIPPNQVVTQKFPVMTAGTPKTADKETWSLTLDGDVEQDPASRVDGDQADRRIFAHS